MKSQGTFEYILLLGGIIIVVLVIINTLTEAARSTSTEVNSVIQQATTSIRQSIESTLGQLGP